MMIHTITMPSLSPTMTEGKLAKWIKQEGDKISPGDILCEIETDKAIMEFESVDEGIIDEILVPAGTENIAVNSPILNILMDSTEIPPSPPLSKENIVEVREEHSHSSPVVVREKHSKNRPIASPLARRLAGEHGIDLSSLSGSGPHGRIVKSDIETLISTKTNVKDYSTIQSFGLVDESIDANILNLFAKDSYEVIPHDNIRKTIACRLQQSKQTIPHFYVSIDCNIDNLLSLREQMNRTLQFHREEISNKISV
ncbi:biotin/lipoyl-containing protein, partial [Candidatus Liberibacter asiaticus]